jgi:hypothetical protein
VFRGLVLVTLLGLSTASFADGPGSRIRADPAPAIPQPTRPGERDAQRCDALLGDAKERCMRELRAATRGTERAPHEGPGPEAPGTGTGTGSGTISGKK